MQPPQAWQGNVVTPEAVQVRMRYADIGSRGVAISLDYTILTLVILLLAGMSETSGLGQIALAMAVFWAYFIISEAVFGKTLGKAAVNIRVVMEDGRKAGLKASAIRNILRIVDMLPSIYVVGMVSMAVTEKDQRLGDLAAGTVVISEKKEPPPVPLYLPPPMPGLPRFDVSALGEESYDVVRAYLLRRPSLPAAVREQVATSIATAIAPRIPGSATWSMGPDLFLEQIAREYQGRSGTPIPPPPVTWLPPERK